MPQFDEEMQELFEGFLVESQELLDSISNDLMIMEENIDDMDLINQIFRSFHTIKGTSGFMGFNNITDITHEAEDILNKIRKNELSPNSEITDVLLQVHDVIRVMIDKIKDDDDSHTEVGELLNKLRELNNSDKVSNEITDNSSGVLDSLLQNDSITKGNDDFTDDEEALLQAAFAEINSQFGNETKHSNSLSDSITNTAKIEEPVKEIKESQYEENKIASATILSKVDDKGPKKPIPVANETIRIDVKRIETLMDLSGELVLGRNRLSQISNHFESDTGNYKDNVKDLLETTAQINYVTSEIQSAVMKMRMVPVGKLYQKAPRIVRDLSKEFNKKINLVVKGEETEIDRGIIEELNDPLVHMIRNSCDHGIESPEVRLKNGKSETGTVTLDAEQKGNHIVLKISDDGQGMDAERLKTKAIEKGIITFEHAAQMTEREAFQLIFAPGFSTAAKITDVSGRGVGMDVVRTNINKLKGIIEIDSEYGSGSSFIIKLPLTLAIIQGLLIRIENETYAIPLSSVEEVVAVEEGSVSTVNQQEVIKIRTDFYPILRLENVLNINDENRSLLNKNVVIVAIGLNKIGLVVDELLGQQEIVIKSLGQYLGQIKGIAGSTILGDGRVIMILDVADLIKKVY
jgi:two-component system chemotaxis sensor kinase CheA